MRVVLEVREGAQAGRTITLQSGEEVKIGRNPDEDAAFPEDSFMSGAHCILQCGVKVLSIRDRESTNGLRVNGVTVQSAALNNGDEIVAGRTRFVVYIRDDARPVQLDNAALAGRSLESILREEFQPLWMILDAARDKNILKLLSESDAVFQSLYEGARGQQLAQVAPYLVRLPADSAFISTLANEGCGKSWGVFLTCSLPLKELRRQFRHFLKVELPAGEKVFFRFYDPRVLRVFLPTCDEKGAAEFFGTVHHFLVEDETPGQFCRFWMNGRGVAETKLTLQPGNKSGVR